MAELIAKTPAAGLLPLTIGAVELSQVDAGHLTSIAPFNGKEKALSEALNMAHGVTLPGANRVTGKKGARVIWFGLSHVLLAGPAPDATLAKYAALTDQSDAWTVVQLCGAGSADVLARLVPVDLRAGPFKRGHTVRTDLMHMSASISSTGANTFMILVFRSMAQTLVHDLKTAMEGVAARR
ncbi:MAG: sarcosine oxidase subunit gamma [Paracoccaceae bacterium]